MDDKQLELFVDEKRQLVEQWMEARDSTQLRFSYDYLTTDFQRLPTYGKRLFYLLVLHAYKKMALQGQTLNEDFTVGEWADEDIEINIRDLLASEKDSKYENVKDYVRGVMMSVTEERNEKGDVRLSHFIQTADFEHRGRIILRIDRRNWQRILNFAKGFKEGELEVLMCAKGEYTPLAYLLFARQDKPILFGIATLRRYFLGDDSGKYPKNNDFMRNVIEAPMKELNGYSPDSFKFWPAEDVKEESSGRGRPKKTNYYFVGAHILANEPRARRIKNLTPRNLLDKDIFDTLKDKYYFTSEFFSINKEILARAEQMLGKDGFLDFLDNNSVRILRAESPQKYLIGALKKYLANKENKEHLVEVGKQVSKEAPTAKDMGDPHMSSLGDALGKLLS